MHRTILKTAALTSALALLAACAAEEPIVVPAEPAPILTKDGRVIATPVVSAFADTDGDGITDDLDDDDDGDGILDIDDDDDDGDGILDVDEED